MPFGHQILVLGPKLRRVRCAGRRALAPDVRQANLEDGVGDIDNGCAQLILMQVAAAGVE